MKEVVDWVKSIIIAVVVALLISQFVRGTTVYNTSMYPNILPKDLVIIVKTITPERGDIVSFKSEINLTKRDIEGLSPFKRLFVSEKSKKNLIKRVIGLPGDKVDVQDGKVYINDELFVEDYIDVETFGDVHIDNIPDGKLFVMGDNRPVSLDSRDERVGLIDQGKIIGKAVFRIFPFNRIGTLH
jgi:signal peptidase I